MFKAFISKKIVNSYWLNLPEHLWIKILEHLDLKSLLNASETCIKFNDLLTHSILNNKLKLFINLRPTKQILTNYFLERSHRKYTKVKFYYFNEYLSGSSEDFQIMIDILKFFSNCIKEIQIQSFILSYYNWNKLMRTLKNVETLELSYVTIKKPLRNIKKKTMKINSLSMDCVVNDLHKDIFAKISVNKVELVGGNVYHYKQFLLKHEELKSLKANMSALFVGDYLSNVKFSLEHLDSCSLKWHNSKIGPLAFNFIRTQTELQTVHLRLTAEQYDILFLKHIINNNPKLKTFFIELHGYCGYLFKLDIHQIATNLSVTHLYFHCDPQNIELSEKMYDLFPNNKVKNEHPLFDETLEPGPLLAGYMIEDE